MEKIMGLICLATLIFVIFGLFLAANYAYDNWNKERKKCWLAAAISSLVLMFGATVGGTIVFLSLVLPAETIEKDGYTYVLDDSPEESIKIDGKRYILSDTSTEAPVAVPQETAVSE